MDLHYKREVAVGTLVVAGFAAFVLGTMWLKGRDFTSGDHTRIEFANVGNLKEASPVRVAGVQVSAPLGKVPVALEVLGARDQGLEIRD